MCLSRSLHRYTSHLFSLSATLSHMPVSYNCGLIPSFSIIIFSQSRAPLLFFLFFLLAVLLLCCCKLLIIYLPGFFSLPLSLLPAPLLQSVSLFLPLLFPPRSLSASFAPAASVFLCLNSRDAFVEGFHSDVPFEQVFIHVCWL